MSPTMLLGRVVLPGIGLLLAAVLSWQAMWNVKARTDPEPPPPGLLSLDRPAEGRAAPPGRISAEGRVVAYPGAEVVVGSEVLGTILAMPAREHLAVRKGDLLAELRADEVRASLREVQLQLVEAEAELRVEQERLRLDRLLATFAPRVPGARRDIAAAIAHRDAAKAAVERVEAEAAKYRILAPIDGTVVVRHADPGETVNPTAPLVTIVDLSRLRIEAEVDEFDVARVAQGARVTVTAEGYRGRSWGGEVEEIGDMVVARQTRPEDPARPSDTRILPVRIALREPTPLKLGQRVEVEIAEIDPDR